MLTRLVFESADAVVASEVTRNVLATARSD